MGIPEPFENDYSFIYKNCEMEKKMSDGLSRANQAGYKSEENNDFCPYCLRGKIEIILVSKIYEVFDTNSTFYRLEYIGDFEKAGRWILYDENENVIDKEELKQALIKKIKRENI